MLPCRVRVVLRWLEARGGGEGVYGDGGALMRGLEVVLVATRVVGDDDVWRWYVVVECGIGELWVVPRPRTLFELVYVKKKVVW